jgi:hypothetical protein
VVTEGPKQNIPIPDPSVLTTEQLDRAIITIKELFFAKFATIESDHRHEKELTAERFRGVYEKFADNKAALDKAFESSEKAIDKTEMTFTNRIVASDNRLNDVRDRMTIIESRNQGKNEGISTIGAMAIGAATVGTVFVSVATLLYNISHHVN